MKDEPAEAAPKPIPSVARDASYLTRSAVGGQKRCFDCQPITSSLPWQSGKHVLVLSSSQFDPTETSDLIVS
jgi:hypothetical protein